MLKASDVCSMYKKREQGMTHTLTIDFGKESPSPLCNLVFLEKFEGVVPDLKHEKEVTFLGFKPEFTKREFFKGVYQK